MRNYTRKDIMRMVEEEDVGFIRLQFTDIYGTLKNVAITPSQLPKALDNQIIAHKRKVLIGKGNISHKQAVEKAEKEFEIYRKREMDLLESDFDKEIKKLKDNNSN